MDFSELGKLWTYNLNYFDFLIKKAYRAAGIKLIKDYINSDDLLLDGKEPYPISVRGIIGLSFGNNNIRRIY